MKKLLLSLFLLFTLTIHVLAQDKRISGKVVAKEDGLPLPGVSIKVIGTKLGTQTDGNGNFVITAPATAKSLEVSYIGFLTQNVNLGSSLILNITLNEDTKQLSEVVVTGTGVATSRVKLGVAVESITAAELPSIPSSSIDQALVGKIAGAQITSANGSPGAPVNILLRGINTLNRGTSPMILLDGVEIKTDLNTIDFNIIDRVEIVQGAASASIYGAQGANGVIQLFSKRGKSGTQIDVSSNYSSSELLNIGDVSKSRFHPFTTNAAGEVIGSSGKPLTIDPETGSYLENVLVNLISPTSFANKPYDKNLKYYDHYAEFFGKAPAVNNSVSISGASEKVNYNFSISDNRQRNVFKNNGDYSRSNVLSNLGITLAKNFTLRSITQLAYTKNTQKDLTGRTIFFALNNTRPFANYQYQTDGDYSAYFGNATGVNGYNPNYMFQNTNAASNKIDLVQNFNLNYKFNRFVELDAKYGLNYENNNYRQEILEQTGNANAAYWQYWAEGYAPFSYATYNDPATEENTGEIDNSLFRNTFQNFVGAATISTDFQKDFNLKIPIKTATQLSYDYRKNTYKEYTSYGGDAPSYSPYTTAQFTNFQVVTDYTEPFVTYGYVVNQRLEYGDIAGVSGGIRSDYSSAFGAGSKPFTFPRADGFLRISQLNLWKNAKFSSWFSELKFRAAYGEAGIQPRPFDRYTVLRPRNIGKNNVFSFPTTNPNPNLDVEVSKEFEAGIDMNFYPSKSDFFRNVSLSLTYWKRDTKNAIYDVDAAPSSGTGKLKDNAFSIGSNGIQASLNLDIITKKTINWSFRTNFSKQTSKITSVVGQPVVVVSAAGSSNYILRAGEKIGQLYGYLMLHNVDDRRADGTPFIPTASQGNFTVASNGWVVNKTTKQPYVTPDKHSFGDPNPKFNMSFINDLSFKGGLARLNFQIDWVYGSHIYNQTKQWMYRDGIHKDYADPITIDGATEAYTAFYRGVYAQVQANGTKNYFYEDASFARLRNVGITLDMNRLAKLKQFRKLELVFSGRNLYTLTNYTGYDPEVSSGANNSAFDRGVDHNTIPNVKTYQIGLNIGF